MSCYGCTVGGVFRGLSESPACLLGSGPRHLLTQYSTCTNPARNSAMMDQQRLHEIESHCTQESPPRCRVACPFDLDVRTFMARMAEGKQGEARKVLERHLPLPGIIARICDHPCENACLRQDLGGSVAMHGLELACMLAVGPQGRPLPLPPKKFRMAIMGAGLAGLPLSRDQVAEHAHEPGAPS